jgi:hypothetical protein
MIKEGEIIWKEVAVAYLEALCLVFCSENKEKSE